MSQQSAEIAQPNVERSRLHIVAALLAGGSVVSLGLTTAVLRVLSQPDRSKLLLKVTLAKYIRTLHDFVSPPIIVEPGDWNLIEAKETLYNRPHSNETDIDKLDLKALVLDGVPKTTGDYLYSLKSVEGSLRNHRLRLTNHGTIGKDENWQIVLLGQDKGKLENPSSLAVISIDSLPTLVTASLAQTLTETRQMVPKDNFAWERIQQIPAIAYFLFVRELVTAYKEMAILQTGSYTSDMQPDSMSLWGNVHDTKIGLYSLTKSELLTFITQAITRYPTLFKLCFGQQPTPEDALNNRAYSGPHELYTASAYRAEAHGANKEWNISAIEVWQFPELKQLVEDALA